MVVLRRLRPSSLRLEVLSLILLVGVPVAALALYSSIDRRSADEDNARENAIRIAQAYENYVGSQVTGTKNVLLPFGALLNALLAPIKSLDEIAPEACAAFFAPMTTAESSELFGLVYPDGRFLCADTDLPEGATLADRPYLADVAASVFPVTVGVDRSPQTGNFVLPVFQPVRNAEGTHVASLVVFVSLAALTPSDLIDTLPEGSFATVTDAEGRIVARYPDPGGDLIGRPPSGSGNMARMVALGTGSLNSTSAEGVPSVLGFVPFSALGGDALVIVGINRNEVLSAALADLWRNSFGFLLFTGLAVAIAWVGSERLIIRPLRHAQQTALRFGEGDTSARVAPDYAHGEIGDLGRSIDTMADAVVERTREIEELNAHLEERVEERTAALQAANQELEAFSYSVSHDLRAPLRAIDGFLQMALGKLGDDIPPDALQHLRRVEAGSHRMGTLIDDLLQFSRVGRQQVMPRVFSMDDAVTECLDDVVAPDDRARVQFEIEPLGSVTADRVLIRRVLDNLVGNAVKFSRASDPSKITIGTTKDPEGHRAFFIRDNGVGFDQAYADKMFGMFQRLHLQEEFEGTGVGLAIVQRVIHKHGGAIWAESAVGEGATFYFTVGEAVSDDE